MTDLASMLRLLDIETIDADLYRGQCSLAQRDRVYGGQVAAQALHHQPVAPDAPSPDSLPTVASLVDDPSRLGEIAALDFRMAPASEDPEAPTLFWFRASGDVGQDQLVHAAIITYASDHTLLSNILSRHGRWFGDPELMLASLDHSMWFHHPRPNSGDWMLYETTSPAAGGSRGLGIGRIYDRAGTLAVSTAQEGLVRLVEPR